MKSGNFRLDQGFPQGSSISPLFFLIFINDIDADQNADTTASLFADETATGMHDGKIRGSNRVLMQGEINKNLGWTEKWKMSVNAGKTKTIIFCTPKADTEFDPSFTANGQLISLVGDYPFLGIDVDTGLRFITHINKIVAKCRKRVNIIKCLSSKDWGNSLEAQRTLYLTYIRVALEYDSSSWSPWCADSNIKKLLSFQNVALRSIAGLYLS